MSARDREPAEKNENILLDAHLVEMISNTAFRATLKNGHGLVAYIPRRQQGGLNFNVSVGDSVLVRMSPFDMSRGQMVVAQGRNHEGKNVG